MSDDLCLPTHLRTLILALSMLPAAAVLGSGPPGAEAPDAAPSITWPERLYDPEPTPDGLILPMPCGGAMAFRAVDIPAGDLLDDRQVELGHTDAERGYKEGRRLSHLAGSFTDPQQDARRFYIGKYEVTRDQYAALAGDRCTTPSMPGRLPVTEVSWFDAVDWSRRYTEWLLANARELLPHEDREPGFLRLPREEEWEFAARGGLAVDEADFLAPLFPMPEGDLARYAWHESSGSAEGELHPVGLLKPNPLGLYDILGNAAEMTLAPFQLDRRGRAHGQAGGFVSRGGDLFTPAGQLGSAVRQEHNYFNAATGLAKTLDSLGFRLVLTAPVIVSSQRLDAIKQAWSDLPSLTGDVRADADAALAQLESVAEQSRDADLRTRLDLIRRDVEQAHAALNEARERTVRALIRMGAFLGKRVVTDARRVDLVLGLVELADGDFAEFERGVRGEPGGAEAIAEARARLDAKKDKWMGQVEGIRERMASSLSYYGDIVIDVGRDYGADEVETQLGVVELELQAKENPYLIPYAALFVRHLADYRDAGAADKARWQRELLELTPAEPARRPDQRR